MKFSIDWPPGFKSAIRVDPRTKKFETDYQRSQRNRLAGGWDRHPVGLGGSYISDGPAMMKGTK